MANVTRARTGQFLRKLFEILMRAPDGMQGKLALEQVAQAIPLTEYELGEYESGGQRFDKIVRFATVDTTKAGWLVKNKGIWSITDAGRQAYASYPDPDRFYGEAVKLYHQWRKTNPEPADPEPSPEPAPGGREAAITIEAAEEQAWSEIEDYLREMPPYDFQDLVASLLRAMGYHVGWVAPPGKDGGVDIIDFNDPLGTRPPRIKVQVKQRGDKVAVDGLRSFMAILGDDDVGLFVSAGGFTKDANDEARAQQTRKITLLDLDRLFDLWVEHYPKLDEEARRRLPLKPIHFLAPLDQ